MGLPDRSMADILAIQRSLGRPEKKTLIDALVGDILEDLSEPLGARPDGMVLARFAANEDRLYGRLASCYSRPCNVQEACLDLGIDRCNMCSAFSKVYGDTPYAFHKRQRLLHASSELIVGDEPIRTIANDSGFQKESKFAKEFQKMFGCTPGLFRKRYRELLNRQARTDDRAPI